MVFNGNSSFGLLGLGVELTPEGCQVRAARIRAGGKATSTDLASGCVSCADLRSGNIKYCQTEADVKFEREHLNSALVALSKQVQADAQAQADSMAEFNKAQESAIVDAHAWLRNRPVSGANNDGAAGNGVQLDGSKI